MTQQTLLLVIHHQEQWLAGVAVCYNAAFWRHLVDAFAYSHKPWNTCFCLRGRSAHVCSVCPRWRNSACSPGTCTYGAKLKWGRGREEQQFKMRAVTYLNSFSPLCWNMWRLRWDFLEKRRPQPGVLHWHGRCGHLVIVLQLSHFQVLYVYFLKQLTWCCLYLIVYFLPLRCAPSHAPSASTVWWKSLHSSCRCSWRAAAAGRRQSHRCTRHSSFPFVNTFPTIMCNGKAAAFVCLSYSLLIALNWLIGGVTSPGGWVVFSVHRFNALEPQVKLKPINLIAPLSSAVCKQREAGASQHLPATQSKSAMIRCKVQFTQVRMKRKTYCITY